MSTCCQILIFSTNPTCIVYYVCFNCVLLFDILNLGQAGDALTGVSNVWLSQNGGYNWTQVILILIFKILNSLFLFILIFYFI